MTPGAAPLNASARGAEAFPSRGGGIAGVRVTPSATGAPGTAATISCGSPPAEGPGEPAIVSRPRPSGALPAASRPEPTDFSPGASAVGTAADVGVGLVLAAGGADAAGSGLAVGTVGEVVFSDKGERFGWEAVTGARFCAGSCSGMLNWPPLT